MTFPNEVMLTGPRDASGGQIFLVTNAEGFWNATAMGKQGGTEWKSFRRTKHSQAVIDELTAELGVAEHDIIKRNHNAAKGEDVTWIHMRIALIFLGSLSPKFANWASGVLERYLKGEITTEESKAAKAAMDSLLEEGRLKYEQTQKQLKAAERDLAITEGRLKTEKQYTRSMCDVVGAAKSQVANLEEDLKRAHKLVTNKDREKAKLAFVKSLREAVGAYARDRTVSSPEAEDGFGEDRDGSRMTIPKFVQAMEDDHKRSDGLGKDWSLFTETPGHGWNIVPVEPAENEKVSVEDFCKHTNFVAGFNHPDKKKVLKTPGEGMHAAPNTKRVRRG